MDCRIGSGLVRIGVSDWLGEEWIVWLDGIGSVWLARRGLSGGLGRDLIVRLVR